MKEIIKGVGFTTDHSSSIEEFKLTFTAQDLEKIKLCQSLIKQHKLSTIEIDFNATEIVHDNSVKPSIEALKIFNDCMYFTCQSKHDSGVQYESEPISNEELGL
jgi:hypothetical protein